MHYLTQHQQEVLNCLAAYDGAPVSAAELMQKLRLRDLHMGISTLYRQLDYLTQQGRVHKALTESGAVYHYCPSHAPQECFLLKCEDCGKIVHVDCGGFSSVYQHLLDSHHFRVDPRRTMLYGHCADCQEDTQ